MGRYSPPLPVIERCAQGYLTTPLTRVIPVMPNRHHDSHSAMMKLALSRDFG